MEELMNAVMQFYNSSSVVQEALSQAPKPVEVPPADLEQRKALVREIHSEIFEKFQKECLRGQKWLRSSFESAEMRELHSRAVYSIMENEVEISAEMDTESLRSGDTEKSEAPEEALE